MEAVSYIAYPGKTAGWEKRRQVKLGDFNGAPRRCPRCLISRHACWRRGYPTAGGALGRALCPCETMTIRRFLTGKTARQCPRRLVSRRACWRRNLAGTNIELRMMVDVRRPERRSERRARDAPRFMAGDGRNRGALNELRTATKLLAAKPRESFVEPTSWKNGSARRIARLPRNARCHLGFLRRIVTPLSIMPSSIEDLVTSSYHMRAIIGRSRGCGMATDGITSTEYVAVRAGAPSSKSLRPTDLHASVGVGFSGVRLWHTTGCFALRCGMCPMS